MRFTEELVGAGDLDVPAPTRAPTDREVDTAAKLVDSLHAPFASERFQDSYRDRVRQLVTAKARGEQPALPEPEASQARTFGWLWVA